RALFFEAFGALQPFGALVAHDVRDLAAHIKLANAVGVMIGARFVDWLAGGRGRRLRGGSVLRLLAIGCRHWRRKKERGQNENQQLVHIPDSHFIFFALLFPPWVKIRCVTAALSSFTKEKFG